MTDSQTDPFYDQFGCLVSPELSAIPRVPARVDQTPVLGWNAGANSITELDGDLHAQWSMPAGTAGVVIGLRSGRERQIVPELVEHGLYFQSVAGADMVQVIESGTPVTELVLRTAEDVYEIRREAGNVTYWIGDTPLYASKVPSLGAKIVNACLYASGDAVGEAP